MTEAQILAELKHIQATASDAEMRSGRLIKMMEKVKPENRKPTPAEQVSAKFHRSMVRRTGKSRATK